MSAPSGHPEEPRQAPSMASAPDPEQTPETPASTVPVQFDEDMFNLLCQSDCGLNILYERLKKSSISCREASLFLKRRAIIEEDYGRQLMKLVRSSNEAYSMSDGKTGSYINSYQVFLQTHDKISENRLRFARQLTDMAEHLSELSKSADRHRKYGREQGTKLERSVTDCEANSEKARARFETAAEDLERILLSKAGESASSANMPTSASSNNNNNTHHPTSPQSPGFSSTSPSTKPLSFGKAMSKFKSGNKNPAQLQRHEEEARQKMAGANDAYRREIQTTHQVRTEYFSTHLPALLRTLKESLDEADNGSQYYLVRYAYLFEHTLVNDGLVVSPLSVEDGPGLKSSLESIDNRGDFRHFMDTYSAIWAQSGQRTLRRDVSEEELVTSSKVNQLGLHQVTTNKSENTENSNQYTSNNLANNSSPKQVFGVDLAHQMARDETEVPLILKKCASAIESHGLDTVGIYRLSGTNSKVNHLKEELDKDAENVDMNDYLSDDINIISGVLKSWFRELPEPLIPYSLYHEFIEAAKIENDRLRHIRLHERVNDLPDPNYATMMYLMGHLDNVQSKSSINSMNRSNIAIVFGPTLFRPPPGQESSQLHDMAWQCKAVETILTHQQEIFVHDEATVQQPQLQQQQQSQQQQQHQNNLPQRSNSHQSHLSLSQHSHSQQSNSQHSQNSQQSLYSQNSQQSQYSQNSQQSNYSQNSQPQPQSYSHQSQHQNQNQNQNHQHQNQNHQHQQQSLRKQSKSSHGSHAYSEASSRQASLSHHQVKTQE